jgi:hypothetical protein
LLHAIYESLWHAIRLGPSIASRCAPKHRSHDASPPSVTLLRKWLRCWDVEGPSAKASRVRADLVQADRERPRSECRRPVIK